MLPDTIIVGGGITGLSAAYELSLRGMPATLLEASPRLGGVIQTQVIDSCVVEEGPDSFLSVKPAAAELIAELGLASQLIGSNDHARITYIVKNRRLVPMPDGLMLMVPTRFGSVWSSQLLGWRTKLRMGLDFFTKPLAQQPERTVAEFIRQHYGQETVDYLADPLLSGVYGGTAISLSASSVLPRFVAMEAEFGSLTKGALAARRASSVQGGLPLFQSLRGGLSQLVDALATAISGKVRIIHGRAQDVRLMAGEYRVMAAGIEMEATNLILACPAWEAAKLLAPVNGTLGRMLDEIEYSSSITLGIGLRLSECGPIPPGFGILVPRVEGFRLVACTFTGAKFPGRVPDGMASFRCFLGGVDRQDVLQLSDSKLVQIVCDELQGLLGWRPKPLFSTVCRWNRAMAQYTLGHQARVRTIQAMASSIRGLYLAGNAYDGIGIPDCIRTGRAAAVSAASSGR